MLVIVTRHPGRLRPRVPPRVFDCLCFVPLGERELEVQPGELGRVVVASELDEGLDGQGKPHAPRRSRP